MIATAKALNEFFKGFGLPAWNEASVPDDAELPYITYEVTEADWDEATTISAQVWYRDTGYLAISSAVDNIHNAVKNGYKARTDNGYLYIAKGSPFAQFRNMEDATLKVVLLNFIIHTMEY